MWQRLGIVASALWIIGGGLWQRSSDLQRAQTFMNSSFQTCIDSNPEGDRAYYDSCMADAEKGFQAFMVGSWGNVAIFALGPVLIGWVFGYLLVRVAKWVLAGRTISN